MSNESFFMVFVEGEHAPAFKHTTPEAADAEAKRLVEKLGKTAFVLMAVKEIKPAPKFIETKLEHDDLPF